MKNITTAGAALLLTTSMANAGGLDRSGQGIGAIFEDGDYVEFSFGQVTPDLSGSVAGGAVGSGNIAPSYSQLGAALKTQATDQLSFAVIIDQPYGADVDYDDTDAGYPLAGSNAQVKTFGITALGRYAVNDNFSVHGGLRHTTAEGVYDVTAPAAYTSTYSSDSGLGFVLGGAYERKDIALRVALTYNSEVDLELDGTAGDLSTTLPESVNLDFQTGVAADTLVFGSVRWVGWDGFALSDSLAGDILAYDDDVITYNIGVGRRINDQLSASLSVGYEKETGEITGNLGPTDGYLSAQLGAAYTLDSGVEISGGVRYAKLGDATTSVIGAEFEDNSALAVGMKVAYNF
ncbi:OmpP1/FadL family transporter [Loktanella sp. Alg231-35]|uniref:OmpP1/FadL family transporter n=1 Tax=Loktanella sp. Alg231-35 TaxID=1922220 RepID=UPI000D5508F5|nr:outer membrane protein transport protein [Loktanella sp. Alg231-35]